LRNTTRDQRISRLADAERKAAALPPQLTIPMVLFFLPVLFAVIFTPGIILYLMDT
jgi:tight adherence protein C